MNLIVIGSKPISFAATASIATWSRDASIRFVTRSRIARGPGPSPEIVPSMTAKMPGWISRWIVSRSTNVSWITLCVQCRFRCSNPPNAFFIAPVISVKTCVFRVGRWTMLAPIRLLGIMSPSG